MESPHKENTERNLYNAPEGTKVVPKVLVVVANYWAKGESIADAWKQLRGYTSKTKREHIRDGFLLYVCFDVTSDTEDLRCNTYVNDFGNVCYHRDFPPVLIDSKKAT